MRISALYALAASISSASAAYQGFNYGSTYTDGSAIYQSGFEALFNTAKNLIGHSNAFTSARLYTMVQAGTSNGVIEAIPAAINTQTTLLLGLWGSGGQTYFNNELAALSAAISTYGADFTSLIAGISIGSEDLYRNSPIGIINKSGVGAQPDELVGYITQVRNLIAGTSAASAPVGHVDTWTAWVNGSNDAVIQNCDFLGMDAYPYFQNTMENSIENGNATFFEAYDNTVGNSFGKPVWITETGWPVSGPTENLAVASLANARTYWEDVACTVLGNINTWWYTLQDSYPNPPPPPSFGLVGTTLSTTPLYDLSCPAKSSSSVASSSTTFVTPSSSAMEVTFSATSASLISTDTSLLGTASPTSVVVTSEPAVSVEPTPIPTVIPTTTEQSATSESLITSVAPSTMITPTTLITTMITSYPVITSDEQTTYTTYETDVVTITSCPESCSEMPVTVTSEETFYTTATPVASSGTTATEVSPPASPTGVCSTDILSGTYEYPHLIVPVSSAEPTKAFGTSYFGEVSSTISSIFNFDIPIADAGKTCSIVFLFPTQAQLETSSYTISGAGGLHIQELSAPATESTTYDTVPAAAGVDVTLPSVTPGNSYVIASHSCGAGERISFEVSATGSLDLQYFQDYNPSPIGFYISVC